MLNYWQSQVGRLNRPHEWVCMEGGLTLGAWARVLADYSRRHQLNWRFTITHPLPDVVRHTQRWTQWYPEMTVLELDTAYFEPAYWPTASGVLAYTPDVLADPSFPHVIGHWALPWWKRWQWRHMPITIKNRLATMPPPLCQPLGKGLYTASERITQV